MKISYPPRFFHTKPPPLKVVKVFSTPRLAKSLYYSIILIVVRDDPKTTFIVEGSNNGKCEKE